MERGLNDLSHMRFQKTSAFVSASSPHVWQGQRHHLWRALQLGVHAKASSTNGDANKVTLLRATIDGSPSGCNIVLRCPSRRNKDTNSLTPFLSHKGCSTRSSFHIFRNQSEQLVLCHFVIFVVIVIFRAIMVTFIVFLPVGCLFLLSLPILTILIGAHQRDGALAQLPLMPWCDVKRCRDRREIVEVSTRVFFASVDFGLAENFDTFHPLATCLRRCPCNVHMLFFWHPLPSNGLVSIGNLRASGPLSDSLVRERNELPKLGMFF